LFAIRAFAHSNATLFKSFVSQTINASFPPSSNTEGFKYFPANDQIVLPAHSDQVRLTQAISFCEIMYSVSLELTMIF
jgi:hypothetical protein